MDEYIHTVYYDNPTSQLSGHITCLVPFNRYNEVYKSAGYSFMTYMDVQCSTEGS